MNPESSAGACQMLFVGLASKTNNNQKTRSVPFPSHTSSLVDMEIESFWR